MHLKMWQPLKTAILVPQNQKVVHILVKENIARYDKIASASKYALA
jgi:hypothetical protein